MSRPQLTWQEYFYREFAFANAKTRVRAHTIVGPNTNKTEYTNIVETTQVDLLLRIGTHNGDLDTIPS